MLNAVLLHAVVSGRLVSPLSHSCLLPVGRRYVSETHYDVLGLRRSATQTEVRSAFLAMSKKLHPDMNRQDPKTHEKFVRVNEAYTVLSRPGSRREYDLNLTVRIQAEYAARTASTSHTYGSSPWPGDQGTQYESDQQRFWDETIWHMRDRTKDKEFEGRPYYGFTSVHRLPNAYIVMGCVAVIIIGAVMHYFAISKSRELHKAVLDEKDKQHFNNLAKARWNARNNGNALQLQILQSKVTNTPLTSVSQDILDDTFTDVKK